MDLLNGMLQKDQDEFRRICNKLINVCFICRQNQATRWQCQEKQLRRDLIVWFRQYENTKMKNRKSTKKSLKNYWECLVTD